MIRFALCISLSVTLFDFTASAAVLYGVDESGPNRLLAIDSSTGVASVASPFVAIPSFRTTGLAFSPDGTLFSVSGGFGGPQQLVSADIDTGTVNVVGTHGLSGVTSLAFNDNGELFAFDIVNDLFVTIDPTTAATTVIAASSLPVQSLAFAPDGTLFASLNSSPDVLFTIDTATGAGTAVGSLGFTGVRGLAFDGSGNLFGSDLETDQLISIDTTTGLGTAIGSFGLGNGPLVNVASLAFRGAPVPEPSSIASSCAMIMLGLAARRRRQRSRSS
ncbi:MAG: PEP-CTERM sorting domain-containing protein [Planctomycetota bacterium]